MDDTRLSRSDNGLLAQLHNDFASAGRRHAQPVSETRPRDLKILVFSKLGESCKSADNKKGLTLTLSFEIIELLPFLGMKFGLEFLAHPAPSCIEFAKMFSQGGSDVFLIEPIMFFYDPQRCFAPKLVSQMAN